MESPRKTRLLTGRILLLLLIALTGWGFIAQQDSEAASALAYKKDQTLYVALLTQPAMLAAFNPSTHKVTVTTVKRKKTPKDFQENAKDLFQKSAVQTRQMRYYIPLKQDRETYWEEFKHTLSSWRFHPLLAVRTLWNYITARYSQRTNLSAVEFILYAMELSRLEMTDFTVSTAGGDTKKVKNTSKSNKEAILPLPAVSGQQEEENRPLIVEILNASGKKGAARELTQYLRNKNQKGLLNVDVLNQDNFPGGRQKETRIIDYAGRREYVKQLSTAIGINSEVSSEKQENPLYDVRIIIGEDFKQPL